MLSVQLVQSKIVTLPNRPPLMLAADLAEFYGVETRRVGEAVKRNPNRFPEDFVMRLSPEETSLLRSQFAIANDPKARVEPLAFTKPGALALATVFKSPVADQVSVALCRAFVEMGAEADITQEDLDLLMSRLSASHTEILIRNPRLAKAKVLFDAGIDKASAARRLRWTHGETQSAIEDLQSFGMIGFVAPWYNYRGPRDIKPRDPLQADLFPAQEG